MSPHIQSRTGSQFSFRPTESIYNEKLPHLCDLWGEERTRVISRALQIAWDNLDHLQPADDIETRSATPINYRPSAYEEDVIFPDLVDKFGTSRSTAICQAIDFVYDKEMERRGINR